VELEQLISDIDALCFWVFVQSLFIASAELGVRMARLAGALLQLVQTPTVVRHVFLVLRIHGAHLSVSGVFSEQGCNEKLGKPI
jgi:hypothetical protein